MLFFVIASLIIAGCGKTKEKLIVEKADINNPKISWEACRVSEFECGHLIVPRDYNNNDGIVYSIALMKLPAKNQEKKEGVILINPGGPGSSGVKLALNFAYAMENIPQQIKDRFDIIGFDPRGTGDSKQTYSSKFERLNTVTIMAVAYLPIDYPKSLSEQKAR